MSLKKNIAANYVSQIYVTAIGIVLVPLYVKYMGAEAYGLVGFFAMLQAWLNLLDMGITPTITRETARFNGGVITALSYRRFVRVIESIFITIAIFCCIVFLGGAKLIALHWLSSESLSETVLVLSLQLMGIAVSLRWFSGLYRGVISGAERQIWLSIFNIFINTLRFVFVLPFIIYFSSSPPSFFIYQLGVALIECIGLVWMAHRLLPSCEGLKVGWDLKAIKPQLKFSMTIAFTSSVWVLATQTDKLVLSKILNLSDFGYFTMAVMVAGGISIVGAPIGNAITPRLARLQAQGNDSEFVNLYRTATQMVISSGMPIGLILIFLSEHVLWAWTGSRDIAIYAKTTLMLYAAGYCFLLAASFPYCLQYAKGDLRIHLIGNVMFTVFLIPTVILGAINYGAVGAGYAWLLSNALGFFIITPIVHNRFLPDLHSKWILEDICQTMAIPFVISFFMYLWYPWSDSRLMLAVELICTYIGLFVISILMANKIIKYNISPVDI